MTVEPDQEQLLQAFRRYEQARLAGERSDLVVARLSLCRLLEQAGWEVPTEVRDQQWRDRRLLHQHEQDPDVLIDLRDEVLRPPSHRPAGSVGLPRGFVPAQHAD